MTVLRLSFTAAALGLALFTDIAAQDTLSAGDKVRVTTDAERVVGSLVSLDDSQLRLRTEAGDSSLTLPLASLTKLEVSRGQESREGRGALIGLFVGVGVGAFVGGAVFGAGLGEETCSGACVAAFAGIGALAGGAVGTAIGVGIGLGTKSDRWEQVPLASLRVSITPTTPDGLGATVRVRWSL